MIVAFWSSAEIRTGVTTNAALISHFYAQRYKKRVALFENHVPGRYSLEDMLTGKRHLLREELLSQRFLWVNESWTSGNGIG